jgi:protein TonB
MDAPSVVTPEVEAAPAPMGLGLRATSAPGVPGGVSSIPITSLASPPPTTKEIPRVGGDIRAPARLAYVPPSYPAIALSARVEGEVVLEAVIDETGVVRNAKVMKSIPLLDRAAIEAVTRWRYSPTLLNGVAVPVMMTIRVRFALR